MALSPGTLLGVFEIVGPLGKGGMGEVYRARDTNLERDVAIKVLPKDLSQERERLTRFRHEAKLLAALNHPNVATVHDFQSEGDTDYLVMELVEGETLAERVATTPLSVKEALTLFAQIAQGLDAAHAQGIIHRDLKPSNVIVTQNDVAKILDFGLAASTGGPQHTVAADDETTPGPPPATTLTTDGQVLGTPPYMSPEQARGKPVDKRTDIWALGCCLYESLTGDNPFRGKTSTDTMVSILEHEPDWEKLPSDVPPEVKSLLSRCLEKEPRRRFSSAGDIAVTLEDAAGALKPDLLTKVAFFKSRRRLSPGVKISISVALVVLISLGLFDLMGRSTNQAEAPTLSEDRVVNSLAVLPFENRSGVEDHKYFIEGLTDSLTGELAKISSIRVISQTSTRTFKESTKSAHDIAEILNVDTLVVGSVYRTGDEVHITVQLVDGDTETQFWDGSWDGEMTDIVKLKAEVALEIARQINATLTGDERDRIASAGEVNTEAYDAYVIGHYFLNEATEEGLRTSIEYFKKATELDPDYAHGWGGLVCAYVSFPVYGISKPLDYYPKARAAGFRALALDYDLAGDQSHMGFVLMAWDWEWEQAEERFKYAIELSPSHPTSYSDYALYLFHVGRGNEAVGQAGISLDLDPTPGVFFGQRILSLVYLESDVEKSLATLRRILREKPDYYPALETLAVAHKYLGKYDEAIATAQDWIDMSGKDGASLVTMARAQADAGNEVEARAALEELDALDAYFDSAHAAYAQIALGDLDSAFERLENGFLEKDWGMVELRTIPYWKIYIDNPNWIRFRNDLRYWDLVKRINFPAFPADHPGYAEELAAEVRRKAEEIAGE